MNKRTQLKSVSIPYQRLEDTIKHSRIHRTEKEFDSEDLEETDAVEKLYPKKQNFSVIMI